MRFSMRPTRGTTADGPAGGGFEPDAIAFGPVPSRRLGQSLGINNIPPKVCSYSCVYCQAGRTTELGLERRAFVPPDRLVSAVRSRVQRVRERGERIDYLSFVPDGEPTLDVNLGRHVDRLKGLGLPMAVLTNGSLLGRPDVREELSRVDWVSVKVDAADEATWRKINRPSGRLDLSAVLEGMLRFSEEFRGTLVTETMLVAGVNDDAESLEGVAEFLARLGPRKAYLSVPTRPPAEGWVEPPEDRRILEAVQILGGARLEVEPLTAFEGVAFGSTGHAPEDVLAVAAVHPLREDALRGMMDRAGASWDVVRSLLADGLLEEVGYRGQKFYRRKRER